jgi:N-acetylneuraminic acid mutarotase
MRQLRTLFLLISAAAILLLHCECGLGPMTGGSGSEVNGRTFQASLKPIAGATVYLDTARSIDTTAMPDTSAIVHLDTATSGPDGNFNIRLENNGVYIISCSANNGGLVAFKSNVIVNRPSNYDGIYPVDVGTLVLVPPGSISGKVVINSSTMANVICYIPGTSFMAISNDTGGFTISNVPPGTYSVYYYYPGYETGKDTAITVVSGQVKPLSVKVLRFDPAGAPPAPIGLAAQYDTANGVAVISWHAVNVADLAGYRVYRKKAGTMDLPVRLTTGQISDTVFSDTIYRTINDTVYQYAYEVTAVDSGPSESDFSNLVQVTAIPPSYIHPVLRLSNLTPVEQSFPKGFSGAGKTVTISLDFWCNITRTNTINWFTRAPDSVFMKKTDVSTLKGSDTLLWVWNTSGAKMVYVNALDERNVTWRDSLAVFIRPAPVNVAAVKSTDSTVTIIWRKSTDPAFVQYDLYAADSGGATIAFPLVSIPGVQDTSYTVTTWKNNVKYFYIVVKAAISVSDAGARGSGGIKNTPPRITTDTAAIAKTANAQAQYRVKLAVSDANHDSLSFNPLSSITGLTITDTAVVWIPSVSDTGLRHISVRVSDGWGGADTISWDVRVTPANVWSSIASLTKARRFLSAAVINGVLYAAGGCILRFDGMQNTLSPSSIVEAFPIASGAAWSPVASLTTARYRTACAPFANKLYSFGGYGSIDYIATVDSFNPVSNSWGQAGQLPAMRTGAAVCAVGTKLYLIGGQSYAGSNSTVTSSIFEWDPASGWTQRASMKKQRMDHQAVVLNSKIYIIGGLGGSTDPNNCGPEQSVEVYDPAADRLDTAASLNTGRWFFGAAEANGKIYAIGGLYSFSTDSSLASVEEYDPGQNVWTIKAALPKGRFGCAAASWQGRIYVVGGAEKTATGTQEMNSGMVFYP